MPGSPNRSTDHFLPQCSTLLDDGTQCVQRGTHGNPNKPQRRCRMHNEVYQEMYFAYKLAGEQAAHIRTAFGRMPEEVEMRRTFDIGLIEKLQSFLNLYRVVVEHELVLREVHSERFMLTMDDGHLAWHAGIQQEIHTVDNVLRWLRQRKLELLTPSPLLRGHRPRSASSAAPAVPVNTVRRHRRGQSEPAPDSYPMESNTVLNSSPCSHPLIHSTESKNLVPHPQSPNGATETPVPEDQSTFPPLEDRVNAAIPPSTTSDAGLQFHMLTPRDVELDKGDPLPLERSLADVDDQRRNLQGTASALHESQAYAKACPPETPSAERDESPIQDARLSVPPGVLNPTFSFPPAPVPEASETPVPQVARLKKGEYLAVEASQTNEGQCCESLHDPPVQSESIPLEEHPLDGGNPQLSDSESPVVAAALSTFDLPHSNQEAHQELHESASPAKESEKGIFLSSTQPHNKGPHSEPQNTSPRYVHDHSSPIPHQQRVSSSDKTFAEIGESLMPFSRLNTSAVAGAIATVVVGAAWLLRNI